MTKQATVPILTVDNFDLNKDGNIQYSEFVQVLKVSKVLPALMKPTPHPPATGLGEFDRLTLATLCVHPCLFSPT